MTISKVSSELSFDSDCVESFDSAFVTFNREDSPVYLKAFNTENAALTGTLTLPDLDRKSVV